MRSIAAHASAERSAALYRTFGDKRTLFLRALDFYGEQMIGPVVDTLNTDGRAIDNIHRVFKMWEAGATAPDSPGCMMVNTCSQFLDAGRGPIPVMIYGVAPRPEAIDSYIEAGVESCVFAMPPVAEEPALSMLDGFVQVMETVAKAGA